MNSRRIAFVRNVVNVTYTLTSVDRETGVAEQHMEIHSAPMFVSFRNRANCGLQRL